MAETLEERVAYLEGKVEEQSRLGSDVRVTRLRGRQQKSFARCRRPFPRRISSPPACVTDRGLKLPPLRHSNINEMGR